MNKKQVCYVILVAFCIWLLGGLLSALYYRTSFIDNFLLVGEVCGILFGLMGVTIGGMFLIFKGYERLADKKKEAPKS